ncbi:uncharacterized protein [Rutidosis leptorrhynchoides]|uniref:uncharacterized protein n=1 Tax=Rutidosis leptorrhynchoides TaxID=125765 RepID=UPI003A99E5EE
MWRALKNRLAVHVELDKHGINLDSVLCPLCDNGLKDVEPSLLTCKQVFDVWERVFKWWNLGLIVKLSIGDVFLGKSPHINFSYSVGLWQAMEWICGYLIWKNQNAKMLEQRYWNRNDAFRRTEVALLCRSSAFGT